MSADGIGVLGGVGIVLSFTPVIVAGVVIAGTAYGAALAAQSIYKGSKRTRQLRMEETQRREQAVLQAEEEERRELRELFAQYIEIQDRYSQTMERLDRQMAGKLEHLSDELKQQLEHSVPETIKSMEASAEKIKTEIVQAWQRERQQLNKTYETQIQTQFHRLCEEVNQQKEQISALASSMASNKEMEKMALQQIQKAGILFKALQIECSTLSDSFSVVYHNAAEYYEKRLFELAYTTAADLTLQCYEEMNRVMKEKEESCLFLDILENRLLEIESQIEGCKTFTFSYGNEKYEENLQRFEPELFCAIQRRIDTVKEELNHLSPVGEIEGIKEKIREADDLELDLKSMMEYAVRRMLYAYAQNDTAEELADALEEQGFELEGYAYEGDSEGQAMHINFLNKISDERLTVVLAPDVDGIHVQVHNYGNGKNGGEADSFRQDKLREWMEQALHTSISCSGRGMVSGNVQEADLKAVKTRTKKNLPDAQNGVVNR